MLFRLGFLGLATLAVIPDSALLPAEHLAVAGREVSFCERNPSTCAAAGELWEGVKRKGLYLAGAAARSALESDYGLVEAGTRLTTSYQPRPPVREDLPALGTLSEADRAPDWCGPAHARRL